MATIVPNASPAGPPAPPASKTPSPVPKGGAARTGTTPPSEASPTAAAAAAPGSPVSHKAEALAAENEALREQVAHLTALADIGTPPKRQPSSELSGGGGGDHTILTAPADAPKDAPATTGGGAAADDDDDEGLVVEELSRDGQTTTDYYNKWDRAAKEMDAALEEDDEAAEAASDAAVGKGKYHSSEAEAKDMTRRAALKAAKAAFDGKRIAEDGRKQTLGKDHAPGSTVVLDAAALEGRPVLCLQGAQGVTYELPPSLRCTHGGANATDGRPLIKLFVDGCADCTVVVRCPLITGTIDVSHCERCTLVVEEPRAGVTVQADLCADLTVRYARGVLGRAALPGGAPDRHRLFHAGVTGLLVEADVPSGPPSTWDDPHNTNTLSYSCTADYKALLAAEPGAGTRQARKGGPPPEEVQWVTELVDGALRTERAVRGREQLIPARASEVAAMAAAAGGGGGGGGGDAEGEAAAADVPQIDEAQALRAAAAAKLEGNGAFKDRHYAQAAVFYTKAIDAAPEGAKVQYLCYSNRAACWLKLGHPEKGRADAQRVTVLAPGYCKGWFRLGLALHMLERYEEAGPALVRAASIEPKNKQVQEALTFAQVKLHQQRQKAERRR